MGKEASTSHWFNTAALALAIDLLFVFPISHGSLFGESITAFTSSIVVPPLDSLAEAFGLESGSTQLSSFAEYAGNTSATSVVDVGTPTPSTEQFTLIDAPSNDVW